MTAGGPEHVGVAATRICTEIACRSDPITAASRLRQLHEINPAAYHHTHNLTPDTCQHCTDEEPRP